MNSSCFAFPGCSRRASRPLAAHAFSGRCHTLHLPLTCHPSHRLIPNRRPCALERNLTSARIPMQSRAQPAHLRIFASPTHLPGLPSHLGGSLRLTSRKVHLHSRPDRLYRRLHHPRVGLVCVPDRHRRHACLSQTVPSSPSVALALRTIPRSLEPHVSGARTRLALVGASFLRAGDIECRARCVPRTTHPTQRFSCCV